MAEPFQILVRDLKHSHWMSEALRLYGLMIDEGVLPERMPPFDGQTGIFALTQNALGPIVVGMAIVYQPEGQECLWLDLLHVERDHRRTGIGGVLIEHAALRARLLGLPSLEFGTLLSNAPMITLAGKASFDEGGVFFTRDVRR